MDPFAIKRELHDRGLRQADVAAILGVSPAMISRIINRQSVSRNLMIEIARLIGMPPEDVFPWYASRFADTEIPTPPKTPTEREKVSQVA